MPTSSLIILMIIACLLFMGFVMFAKPIKILLKVIVQGTIGMFLIYVINFVMGTFGLTVGLNLLNAGIVGLLGAPGIASLYILQIVL